MLAVFGMLFGLLIIGIGLLQITVDVGTVHIGHIDSRDLSTGGCGDRQPSVGQE